MGKDPAVLWYWNDWNSGTSTLSRFLKGCYMDLLHAQFNNGRLSISEIKTVLGTDFGQSWPTLQKKFKQDEGGLYYNERAEIEKNKRQNYVKSRRDARSKADEDNVRIYIIKDQDTGYVKIGSSVNPQRRYAEMINQINPGITVGNRNYTLEWVSDPVERKIEKTIHDHFSKFRVKGEWFNLSEDQIHTLIRTFFRTSEHTTIRMENENRSENIDLEKGGTGEKEGWYWDQEKQKFMNDGNWIFAFCRSKSIDQPTFERLATEFVSDLELKEDYKSVKEIRKHFTNWFNKTKPVATAAGKSKSGPTAREIEEAENRKKMDQV